MALLFMDGFDAGDLLVKWSTVASPTSSTTTRFGVGRSASLTGSTNSIKRSISPSTTVTVGYAYTGNTAVAENGASLILSGDTGSQTHLLFGWESATSFAVWRNSTGTLLANGAATAPNLANGTGWAYVEVQATLSDTTGTVKVRVNGQQIIDFTGDTRNGGVSNLIDAVEFKRTNVQSFVDDVYVLNSSGATHNTFLGDVRVHTVVPTGAGNSTQLTPSTGANWAAVDELPYSASDYVSGTTAGLRDTYVTSDLPASVSSVKAVQVNAVAKKTDAGDRGVMPSLRFPSAVYNTGSQALATSDTTVTALFTSNPHTSAAWTAADVNAMEIGVEVA